MTIKEAQEALRSGVTPRPDYPDLPNDFTAAELIAFDPKAELETVRKAVESFPFSYEGQTLNVTVTIGAAWYDGNMTIDEWIDAADRKLYEGKQAGKNRVVF